MSILHDTAPGHQGRPAPQTSRPPTNPSSIISGSVARTRSNPRGLKQLRTPAHTAETPRRGYDGTGNFLQKIDQVTTALVFGTKVSVDHVCDHWNLLVKATTLTGSCFYLVVSKRGWVPARPLDREDHGDDGYGRSVKFSFTTDVPQLRSQRLSYADRQKLLGGIAGRFLGEPDWNRVKAVKGRAF